jgi:uncharacterized peroxidase-related enzyme
MRTDYHKADVPEKDIRMLEYAEMLTSVPCDMRKQDIARLRDTGFRDSDILDIAQVTAYYNYVNRLACGLGVELEEYWQDE